jgi:hypothetical protein
VATAWVATDGQPGDETGDETGDQPGDQTVVSLGDERGDHLSLALHRLPRIETAAADWVPPLAVRASLSVGDFAAMCMVSVREEELIGFRRHLARVCASQEHEAALESRDERLCVRIRRQVDGTVHVHGHASDDLRDGCTLAFALRGLDQRSLPRLLRGLHRVEVGLGLRPAGSGPVEVRSRFNGTWVPGFEVAEVHDVDTDRLYRLRRCSDGVVLPTHFGADEVRTPLE